MKTKKKQEFGSGVLYKVDPSKLSIKLCSRSQHSEEATECTTTFENFTFDKVKLEQDIPDQLGQLPAFVNGAFYFGTEEEAQNFIRTQIGM